MTIRQMSEKNPIKSNKTKMARSTEHSLALRPDTLPVDCAHEPKSIMRVGCGTAKTRVVVKYDVGFSNHLTIRGNGANLSWDRGQPLKNIQKDEWIWETDQPFHSCEFKVLLNDSAYEVGGNHSLHPGASLTYTPHF